MASHIHDPEQSKATPICGAASGVCVDRERALCPKCLALAKQSDEREEALRALAPEGGYLPEDF